MGALQEFIARRKADGVKTETLNASLAVVRRILNLAASEWIGRAISQRQATIHRILQATGGIAPVPRSRSSRALSLSEREEISRGICAGDSFRTIAKRLTRAVSTVSQEVARHGGQQRYRATEADWALSKEDPSKHSGLDPHRGNALAQSHAKTGLRATSSLSVLLTVKHSVNFKIAVL